eukprot:TRINITY_DN12499_c0_g1_i1.p1 TRINITY_DN12499_c0_g1~~TRINITY_DN12499_c0_g1_i1.p1  ORF type:complete len:205 (+),score=50.87 TRINITY_DN12499_c0_g1_i1:88-702(+)
MNLRLFSRRMRYWSRTACGSVGAAGRSSGGLLGDIWQAYFAGASRTARRGVTAGTASGGWRKTWNSWMVALGLRRRMVQKRRKRNAQHLTSLEGELEDLKAQLAAMEALLNPPAAAVPNSSQGCPTSISPVHAQGGSSTRAPPPSAAQADCPPPRRPPPPPRRRAPHSGAGTGTGTGSSTSYEKIRLRPAGMPQRSYADEGICA